MAPPPLPLGAQAHVSHLPNVSVPSAWLAKPGDYVPSAIGYTPAHDYYRREREQWGKKSYQEKVGETVKIIMQVLYAVPGKAKGNLVEVQYFCFVNYGLLN